MRLPVTIKNTDQAGRVMEGKWFVKVGKRHRVFSQPDWARDGVAWVSAQILGTAPILPPAKKPSESKLSEEQK